jgi:hypothetical protein
MTNNEQIEEVIRLATKWTERQYTLANSNSPEDRGAQKDAQARIELVDYLRSVYQKNE